MDIEKENDKYLVSLVTNCGATQDEINDLNFNDETGLFESNRLADWFINQINFGWRVWQADKAKAIPEGFVLMPKEPTQELLNKMQDFFVGAFENGLTGGQSMHCAYIAMIEVQESAND